MKNYTRLQKYKISIDYESLSIENYKFEINFFSHWPDQRKKTLNHLILPNFKMIFIKEGSCTIHFSNETYELSDHDFLILPPFTLHSASTSEHFLSSYEIFFNVLPLVKELDFINEFSLQKPLYFKNFLKDEFFNELQITYQACNEHQPGSYLKLLYLTKSVFVNFCQLEMVSSYNHHQQNEARIIQEMFTFLTEHYQEPIRVRDVCLALNLSQSYLYRCTRNIANCSCVEFINKFKMIKAQQLLKDSSLSISEISQILAYSSLYYFSNLFKKTFQISPSEYRKANLLEE